MLASRTTNTGPWHGWPSSYTKSRSDFLALLGSAGLGEPAWPKREEIKPNSSPIITSTIDLSEINGIDSEVYLFLLEIPGTAKILLAADRKSIDNPEPLVDPSWAGIKESRELPPKLNSNASYGGTRLVCPGETLDSAIQSLMVLAKYESGLKHGLINNALDSNGLKRLVNSDGSLKQALEAPVGAVFKSLGQGYKLPEPFLSLRFRGGRCVIFPENKDVYDNLLKRDHSEYEKIFKVIGRFLNGKQGAKVIDPYGNIRKNDFYIPSGSLFLTPDYGSNADVANILHEFTPNVLGVKPEVGGGAGKSSYTVSWLIGAFDQAVAATFGDIDPEKTPITLIGSAGSVGEGFASYLASIGCKNVRICDINYMPILFHCGDEAISRIPHTITGSEDIGFQVIPDTWDLIRAENRKFTDEALSSEKPQIIVATTVGHELENSHYNLIHPGSLLILAHNFSLPVGKKGIDLARAVENQKVMLMPGQCLTAGGAAYSRFEISHRAEHGITKAHEGEKVERLPKAFVHATVNELGRYISMSIINEARRN